MPFKSEKQRRTVMALLLKGLRGYYKEVQGDTRRDHRVMINPRTGRIYTDKLGTHYSQMAGILKQTRTKSPWLATYLDVGGGSPLLSERDGVYRFIHTGLKTSSGTGNMPLRRRGYEVSSVTDKDVALIADINRRFRKIYGHRR